MARGKAVLAMTGRHPAAWEFIGPTLIPKGQTISSTHRVDVAGRVACIAIDPDDPQHLLLGAAAGGIWESPDDGATWHPRTDHLPSLAIGAIAFDPSDPRKVFAGSGEGNFYANLGAGDDYLSLTDLYVAKTTSILGGDGYDSLWKYGAFPTSMLTQTGWELLNGRLNITTVGSAKV